MKKQHHFSLGAHILYYLAFILFMIVMIGVTPPRRLISMQQGQGGMRKRLGGPMYFEERERAKGELGMELYPTGSSLPDCSHACGPCFPCKRVMVSFKCSTESCPIVYRCTCKGKYYHVPSN